MIPLLQIKNLKIDFLTETGRTTAIENINLTVHRGEIIGIAGESGSGKSVTSLAILQLLSKTATYSGGEILYSADGGTPIDLLKLDGNMMRHIRGKKIAMIFQEPMTSLNPVFTCGEQVAEAIRTHLAISPAEARQKTVQLFSRVQLPDPSVIYDRYPHQLSGGQKQRVMIAMAMSGDPSLLICDEPTTALDVTVQKTVLELIRSLQQETGMSVIFITHDLGVIKQIASRLVVMYRGAIVEEGTVEEVFRAPKNLYTKALLACRPALHEKGSRLPVVSDFLQKENKPFPDQDLFPAASNDKTARVTSNAPGPILEMHQTPLIRVENLSVKFPSSRNIFGLPRSYKNAVNRVSFDVFEGETLGLVGESGCGKTTLGRALLNLIKRSSGTIWYRGQDLHAQNHKQMQRFRKNMQLIFQDPYSSLNPSITIGAIIAEPMAVHFREMSGRARKTRVLELLEKVGLDASSYNKYPHEFSGGQRQRIVIARALGLEPEFIVCDESVSALDVSVQAQVLNLLNDLKKEYGYTNLFISHDLSVVRFVSDRIMVMNQGQIEEIGPAEAVYRHPRSAYTQKLLDAVPAI